MAVIITEYPKWIEFDGDTSTLPKGTLIETLKNDKGEARTDAVKILVKDEDSLFAISDDNRKKEIQDDLQNNHGISIDLRKYKGDAGLGALEAYYLAASKESKKK